MSEQDGSTVEEMEDSVIEETVRILDLVESEHKNASSNGISFLNRMFTITGDINANTYHHVFSALHALNHDTGPIKVVLNSPGGEVQQGFAIYELLKSSENPVHIYGIGHVMSIASIILQAGEKRYMTPYCRFMVHNGSVSYDKPMDVDKIKAHMKDIKMDADIYYDLLGSRSSITRSHIVQMCNRERYLSAQQCLEAGLIDGIEYP